MQSVKVFSPGRINIIGGHTDYNNGLVLPAAIDKGTTFEITKNGSKHSINVHARNLDESLSFDLLDDSKDGIGWKNYVIGVVKELQKLGCIIEGFDAEFKGDVPIGSGMSSSAALECSLAFGLNHIFDLELDRWQIIKACQMAEHNYVGTKCGIMDQFASVMGKPGHVMLLDCKSLNFDYFPSDMANYKFLLLNTNVAHNLASSEYNKRREECSEGLSILNKADNNFESLSDVPLDTLKDHKESMSQKVYNRCLHIISENIRVSLAANALKDGDLTILGKQMYAAHKSLKECYEVSCTELDFLVKETYNKPSILGSRMMGGGFGGCTLNLIREDNIVDFVSEVSNSYYQQFGIRLSDYVVTIGGGTRIIE